VSTILSPGQIAYLAGQAGFQGDGLVDIVAIDEAESGGNPGALGDTSLEDATWGPSVGLGQIRSLKAQTGSGGVRDEQANLDPLTNLQHQFTVSAGGTDFRAWSTWWANAQQRLGPGHGAFEQYLPVAEQAAANPEPYTGTGAGAQADLTGLHLPKLPGGLNLNPLDGFGLLSSAKKDIAKVVVNGLLLSAGLALVVLGVYTTANPGISIKGAAAGVGKAAELGALA